MVERRQLPPQIKRVELAQRDGGRAAIRYQLTVDVGVVDGKRKQLRKRYATEREARAASTSSRTPRSRAGRRTLPIPDHLAATLRAARAVQAADRLALGEHYEASGYLVVDEAAWL
jgi:hypothetical protein